MLSMEVQVIVVLVVGAVIPTIGVVELIRIATQPKPSSQ